jgi:phenylacetate-coenzyme A ligase PaaK-like adenylate-forming protein
MDVVQGRVTDVLHLPDGTSKHALSVIYPLRETPGVRQFRVVQHEDYSVTVEVVAEAGASATSELQRRIHAVLDDAVPVAVRRVDSIPLTRAGKFRHVISHARRRPATQTRELQRVPHPVGVGD